LGKTREKNGTRASAETSCRVWRTVFTAGMSIVQQLVRSAAFACEYASSPGFHMPGLLFFVCYFC